MRTLGRCGLLLAAFAFVLPSCIFIPRDPATRYRDFLTELDRTDSTIPHITIQLHAFGDDAIDVYTDGTEESRLSIAEATARALGEEFPVAEPSYFEDNIASVQLSRHLPARADETWTLTLTTSTLSEAVDDEGYSRFDLLICPPHVETRFSADVPPDFEACLNGRAWEVGAEAITITMTMRPQTEHYLVYIAATLIGLVLLGGLAWFVGSRLREGPFRYRSSSAVAVGIIGGVAAIAAVTTTIVSAGAGLGPADNLALAKNLGVGSYILSVGAPAALALIPGLIFMILLVKKRPWPDELIPEIRTWPAPPPPTRPPTTPPPPPISWGSR